MAPSGIGQCKLVQAVRKCRSIYLNAEVIKHREVRQALATWRVLLGEVDLAFGAEPGTPLAHAALQGAQHAAAPLTGIAALQLFEQGHGVEPDI